MPDAYKFPSIAFAGRVFLGPYFGETVQNLTRGISGFVVDVGCGKGGVLEVLGLPGIGIDVNPNLAEEARRRNPGRQIWSQDAKTCLDQLPQTPDLIACLGASQAIGTPKEALARFAELLAPGGHLLFGDGFWEKEPSPDYLEFLGANRSDMTGLEEAFASGFEFGLTLEDQYVSSQSDWDSFEDSYYNSTIEWCNRNPHDPDSEPYREKIERWRRGYLAWGRGTLGFAIGLYRKSG